MASSFNVGNSSSNNTGITTDNPQSTGQDNGLGNTNQSPQSLVGSNSINVQSTGTSIPLQPASLTTAAVQPTITKSTHKISGVALALIAILVIVAIASCVYIYMSSKKTVKNT